MCRKSNKATSDRNGLVWSGLEVKPDQTSFFGLVWEVKPDQTNKTAKIAKSEASRLTRLPSCACGRPQE